MFVCIYVDSCSHFLLWLAFLFIVVDFVCLRRNCTNGKRIFVHYALLCFCFAQIQFTRFCYFALCSYVFFFFLCYASKSSVKDAASTLCCCWNCCGGVVVVVSQYKKEQRKKSNVQAHTLPPTHFIRRSQTHAQFVFWLRKLFHGHMYTHS